VLKIINSASQEEMRLALMELEGRFSRELAENRDRLFELLVVMEAALDFSEQGIELGERREGGKDPPGGGSRAVGPGGRIRQGICVQGAAEGAPGGTAQCREVEPVQSARRRDSGDRVAYPGHHTRRPGGQT